MSKRARRISSLKGSGHVWAYFSAELVAGAFLVLFGTGNLAFAYSQDCSGCVLTCYTSKQGDSFGCKGDVMKAISISPFTIEVPSRGKIPTAVCLPRVLSGKKDICEGCVKATCPGSRAFEPGK